MSTKDRYKNPHYYRDYFRAQGEKRRAYLRARYASDPSLQKQAKQRYMRKPAAVAKRREQAHAWRQRPEVKARLAERRRNRAEAEAWYRLKKVLQRYGVTRDWYLETLEAQNGCCAICRADNPRASRFKRLHVDHCHASSRVRGLLCNSCNRGIGWLGDNPAVLFAAAQYLLRHQSAIPKIT